MAGENAIATKVNRAVSVLDFNAGTFAYFMARQGEQVTARFFGICIAFLNEIATLDDETFGPNDEKRRDAARKMMDTLGK